MTTLLHNLSGQLRLFIRKFRYEIIALIFTVYGMYLRFVCLAKRDLWVDEVVSLNNISGAFKPFWQRFEYVDYTFFPGEYIINWPFVALFGTNKLGIAIPHILFTFFGFYLLYLICKRYFSSIFAWIAAFALVVFHRELIFHSFELRPYAVLPTLALAAFYFTEQIISSRYRLSLLQKMFIAVFFIFTIIYHSYSCIILFSIFVYFLLCESKERTFKAVFKHSYRFISVIIIIGLPLYLWYSLGNPHVLKGIGKNIFEFIPDPRVNLFGFTKSVLCNLIGSKALYLLAIVLVFPFFLSYRDRFKQIAFLFVLVIFPIMLVFCFSILVGYWILQRQFIWVMPLFAFLIGWCINSFIEFIRQKIAYK